MMKTCNRCLRKLPTSEFYRDLHAVDNLLGQCKDCKKVLCKVYRDANREELKWKARVRFSESPKRRLQVREARARQKASLTW